jgi:hypothetical protein
MSRASPRIRRDTGGEFEPRKKIVPRFPEADPMRRGVHPPAAIVFHIVTAVAAGKRGLDVAAGERSAAVMQQLFLANACCEPRVELLFCK